MAGRSHKSYRDVFWDAMHQEGLRVPNHLKKIMFWQSLDSLAVMSALDIESALSNIELFVRSKQYKNLVPDDARFQDYYGITTCVGKPEEFIFSEGERVILKLMNKISRELTLKMNAKAESTLKNEEVSIEYVTSAGIHSTLLSMLERAAASNASKKKGGFRYSYAMKYITAFIYILGGPILYKTISYNLSIPSISTARRFIHKHGAVVEGSCRSSELKKFLQDRKLPLEIWLSEDATRLTNRVQYDSISNQLVGFVLPLDLNSMPITNSFSATSLKDIEDHFKNDAVASLLYVYIAQPLTTNAPYFCVCLFGTDNKFTSMNVMQRWDFMKRSLANEGIRIVGCSGDGDPRILKAMRCQSQLGLKNHNAIILDNEPIDIAEFHCKMLPELVFVQDPVHVGTKMRTRVLSSTRVLPMGDYCVSITHVKMLMKMLTKDKHCLIEKDVNPTDKMNFPSVVRLTNPKVIQLLRDHVTGSDATQVYLQIVLYTTSAFLSKTLTAAERLYCCWYAVFFMRIWRTYLDTHISYNTTDNFISSNTYTCMEINAHGLLNLVLQCLKSKSFNNFLPWLYGSQPCESFFRTYRSMSNIFLTVTNSTLLESLHKLNKIQLLCDIVNYDFQSVGEKINFPITTFLNASSEAQKHQIDLSFLGDISKENSDLNVSVIKQVLSRAKCDAYNTSKTLGMEVPEDSANQCKIIHVEDIFPVNDITDEVLEDDIIENDDYLFEHEVAFDFVDENPDDGLMSTVNGIELKSYPQINVENLKPDSPYLVVQDKEGKDIVVRKSSICWMLNQNCSKLSSDRLQRVQDRELCKGEFSNNQLLKPQRCDKINEGDWCLFKQEIGNKSLIGVILSFAYYNEKTSGRVAYSSEYAMLEGNKKDIGVLCQWYENNGKILKLVTKKFTHGYHDISYYQLTIPAPRFDKNECTLHDDVYREIKHLIEDN